jgi:TRAP-type uncharacterized transport system substrate-binding protein
MTAHRLWRSGAVAFAFGTGLALLAALAFWYFDTPTRFTIAVPASNEALARALVSFARSLREQDKDVQLDIVRVKDLEESGSQLQQNKVDLALVRPDVFLPSNGMTIAIMNEPTVVILAPSENIADLAQKRVGAVVEHDSDLALLGSVLGSGDAKEAGGSLLRVPASEVNNAFASKQIEALATVAPLDHSLSELVATAQRNSPKELSIVELSDTASLVTLSPAFTEVTIPAGSLGTRPRLPDDDLKSVATSYRLMARADLDRSPVSEVTEYLFQMRSRIAKHAPVINLMKAPDDDTATSAALPNHPGAIDYFTREQQTFMDRYGDWVWLALFLGGGVSSAAAWAAQVLASGRRERVANVLNRLLGILREARMATSPAALDALSVEIDTLVMETISHTQSGATDPTTMSALMLAIDAARAALSDQRAVLSQSDPRSVLSQPPPARSA